LEIDLVKEKRKMKCPNCGSHEAKFLEKKKQNKPRESYKAKCKKCKKEFDARDYYDVVSEESEKVEIKKEVIKMKYKEENISG